MSRLLLLEDDRLFAHTLEDFLQEEGFEVCLAHEGAQALELAQDKRFDLFLLDINVPGPSGIEVLRRLRSDHNEKPALFLTSHSHKETLLDAFGAGADDFVGKPVDLDELLMRIQALLRRNRTLPALVDLGGGFFYDLGRNLLALNEKEQTLPRKCAELLGLLVQNLGKTVTMEMIEEALYDYNEMPSFGSVRVYISQLKKVLGADRISNLRGIGYRLEKP